MKRVAIAAGCLVALILPASALARKTPPFTVSPARVARVVTCPHIGITGPTGKVTARIYVFKKGGASQADASCARAAAVIMAGKRFLFGNLKRSVGRGVSTASGAGGTYAVEEVILPGASGPAGGFIGDGTAIVAITASGR